MLVGDTLVFPSPPHKTAAAGAAAANLYPGKTSVHLAASVHFLHPSAHFVQTNGALAAAELK